MKTDKRNLVLQSPFWYSAAEAQHEVSPLLLVVETLTDHAGQESLKVDRGSIRTDKRN